jgi:hypothetical protein
MNQPNDKGMKKDFIRNTGRQEKDLPGAFAMSSPFPVFLPS